MDRRRIHSYCSVVGVGAVCFALACGPSQDDVKPRERAPDSIQLRQVSEQPGEPDVRLAVGLEDVDPEHPHWFTLTLLGNSDELMLANSGALSLEVDGEEPASASDFEEFRRDPYDFRLGWAGAYVELIRDEETGVYSGELKKARLPPGTELEFAPGKHLIRPTYTLSDHEVELVERHMDWSLGRHIVGPTYELTISTEVGSR